ncbi:MAG: hypothetical protein CMO55_20560 [Verrucomicrobiales bacterium]|nr:hypothetical protein [Verrucomicrobiales bacterium]
MDRKYSIISPKNENPFISHHFAKIRFAQSKGTEIRTLLLKAKSGFENRNVRRFGMQNPLLVIALTVGALSLSTAEDLPVVYSDDFSGGIENWEPTDESAWKITEVEGNQVYENLGGSKYEPPYRSPKNISLLKGHAVGDFVLTAKVQTTKESYGHRDMCLFFGYQNPANYYYIHLGQKADPHANQIFLVNEAPRVAITEKGTDGTPWKDKTWHDVKIVRKVADGLIEIYFDDMDTPTHVAHDKTFTWGRIGLGTFDDKGMWDDVELRGVKVEIPTAKQADPKQLKFQKWTPDFPVPDPVALSFDPQGRAYVTQTQRRKANDLDIRPNSDWIPNDLSFQSIEDKMNFYREQFTPENSEKNKERVADYTGDGIHDIKDLTALTERVHLIWDSDGDGLADKTKVFAEDLNHLIGGVAGGVLFHDKEVFVCPVPELVRFRDTDGDDVADEKEVLVSGFGVHLAYAGHDMHGLSVGPDGRIYWSVGDKGIRVKTPEGLDYRYPNQGGLMRCEPDGSNFEVYAHGQRNIQEVAFDQYGNFFGVDNDADYPGERERFVQIEQYTDLGWRSNWQYLREGYNPWIHDNMHTPYEEGQPAWFTPPRCNYENGPAGFKMNPGTALGPEYQDYFFLTSAPRGEQWAFQIRPDGDSFQMVNDHKIGEGVPLVGLCFGPDGALYGVDWGGGYPLNESGAVWRIDVGQPTALNDRDLTQDLIAADFGKSEKAQLVKHLGFPDQRVRLKAQFELAKRGDGAAFTTVAGEVAGNQMARIHAIWGLGQLIRKDAAEDETLVALFDDADPEIRAQAIRTVTDQYGRNLGLDRIPGPGGESHPLTETLVGRLDDPSQRVRMQALLGLGRLQDASAFDAVVKVLDRKEHNVGMTYLRHAGVIAFAGCAPTDKLVGLKDNKSDFVRTCAVIALRKRGAPEVTTFLSDTSSLIAGDAARAIHDDWMIPDAFPALAESLGKHLNHEPFTRRAISANYRLGDGESAGRVAQFVAAGEADEELLEAGLEALENWTKPEDLDLVIGRYRPLEERDAGIVAAALKQNLDAMLTSKYSSVRQGAMALAQQSNLKIANDTLVAVVGNQKASAGLRSEALKTLSTQKAPELEEVVSTSLKDKADSVSETALEILAGLDSDKALTEIQRRVDSDASIPVKQHAIRQLPQVGGNELMENLVLQLKEGKLDAPLQLDVLETAKDPAFGDSVAIAEPVQAMEAEWMAAAATDVLAPFKVAMAGGDKARGKSVFMNHAAAQCIRCHKVEDGKGSNVGPNLKDIGKKRDMNYLLESLVDPQKVVAKGYGTISLTLKDGTSIAGQFRKEEKGVITLRDAENNETKISVEDVKERTPVVSTMPPMGYILKKDELRDILAYLASLKKS